jgi:hypothetical protein
MNPGNTIMPSEEYSSITLPSLTATATKMIVLASNDVNDNSLFLNGLTQNIVILYDLFESMGYQPYLLQHCHGSSEKKDFIRSYRSVSQNEIVMKSMPIHMLIEIGMSLDPLTRGYLRTIGCKIVKLYLGNILNIDIETIQNTPGIFFGHHIVGEIDEIWTSPHYMQHIDYASLLNRVELDQGKVVPYVWDPCFLTHYSPKEHIQWIPPTSWQTMDLVIMDPNISFQKYAFYTLLLAEAFSKKYPEWKGNIHVINGDRLKLSANAYNHLLGALSLWKKDRIKLSGRKNIHTILKENRSACFLTHQWNNDYNYMTLELLHCNYPILHNSEGWAPYGYHYSINEWDKAIQTLFHALSTHKAHLKAYQTHAANLIWKHSIHNPEIQERWRPFLSKTDV